MYMFVYEYELCKSHIKNQASRISISLLNQLQVLELRAQQDERRASLAIILLYSYQNNLYDINEKMAVDL